MKFLILSVLLLICAAPARAGDPVADRTRFRPAYDAALAGRAGALEMARGLEHYPLYPYLTYLSLRQRLSTLPVAQVETFLNAEAGTYLGERLRGEWLRQLGQLHQWPLLARFATKTDDPTLGCLALRAKLAMDQLTVVTPEVEQLWLVGKSQIAACDPVFEHLRGRGALPEALVLQRVWLALAENRGQLASFLLRRFTSSAGNFDKTVTLAAAKPAQVLQQPSLRPDSPRARAVVGLGLVTLAGKAPAGAQTLWREARARYHFTERETGVVLRAIALGAVAGQHPERRAMLANVPASGVDTSVERLRLREALQARDWGRLAAWTDAPPVTPGNVLRWRYWHARALAEQDDPAAADAFRAVAGERDYYGFLASDALGVDYSLGHQAVAPSAQERTRVGANPGVARAREFYRLGLRTQAQQEWQWVTAHLPKREVEVAAHLAHEWGWYDRAIIALGAVQSYDDLELRFPLLYESTVRAAAKRRSLPPALVYSIIRGESAFVVDARSVAGALGLMQLLPGTAEETARHLGLAWRGPNELLSPEKNIMLGSEYLRRVMRQFGGSFPLAAAAYNAGPGRVKSWLAKDSCAPPDVWVELIPFTETEGYVRRALFYAAIYEHRMGESMTQLSSRMAEITRAGANGSSC